MYIIARFHEYNSLIDLRRLRHVVTLARSGSYVRAAEVLALTQSALSRSIQAAEADYGVRLFDRGRSGVALTAAGRALVEEGEHLLRDARALDDTMRRIGVGAAGDVKLGLGPLIASASLPFVLPALIRNHPAIRIQVIIDAGSELLPQLASDEIEFAICSRAASPMGEEHEAEPICDLQPALLARAGHPLAGRRVTEPEVRTFPMIGGKPRKQGELLPFSYAPHLACDNAEILRELTQESDALWMSSPVLAVEEIEEGRIVAIDCPELLPACYEVVKVTRRRRTQSPAAELVAGQLAAALIRAVTKAA
ncbi:LysR family transcriptional regulator [Sphingobium mellinum]|uniref:LysR family transcriptional regulator n=1 Tax=Sphingobium mellinum TaxID=1387166 RepID=UPI0030EB6F4D